MDDGRIILDVLNPSIIKELCSDICHSTCCNTKVSDHYVPVEIVDYENLKRLRVEHMISFFSGVEKPQLLAQPWGDCVFLDPKTRLCQIYEFRPLACRKYPFPVEEDDEVELPTWCELYHRSSQKVINKRIKHAMKLSEKEAEYETQIQSEVLMEYLQRDKSHKNYIIPDFLLEREMEHEDSHWRIETDTEEDLELILEILKKVRDELMSEDWYIVNLIIYTGELRPIGLVHGLIRNQKVEIPYVTSLPLTVKEYEMLLGICISTKELKQYAYNGVYFTEAIKQTLDHRKDEAEPLIFESQ